LPTEYNESLMKIIIFAGGTGKRFWPASRKHTPKQFLPVIDDKPLIRLKYDYLRLGYPPEDIFLDTGRQYEKEVRQILPELPTENFIFEPDMRDTGPAIAYAATYVARRFPDASVSLQWSDHYIKKPTVFIHALQEAEKYIRQDPKMVIICEQPRFASPHRGYVKFGRKLKSLDVTDQLVLSEFVRFVEKPTLEVAQQYLQSGDYAWNLGYFVAPIQFILDKYAQFAPHIYQTVQKIADQDFAGSAQTEFSQLEKNSFDYLIAENLNPDETRVINTNMGWYDVGEWISLKETLEKDTDDTVTHGNVVDVDSKDSLIYNYDDQKLVATINLKEMIVVNTPDVVAIFHKDDNDKIKQFLNKLENPEHEKYL